MWSLTLHNMKEGIQGSEGFAYVKMNTFHDFRQPSGHWPRSDSRCVRFDCMFTNVDYVLLKTKTRIRPVHAHHLCRALFFNPFIDPCWMEQNQNKRALPSPKALKDSLKYRFFLPFRKPGNRNLAFIPRRNNTSTTLVIRCRLPDTVGFFQILL